VDAIEDQVGQVMAEHDHEAPAAADLLRALERARRPPRLPLPRHPAARWYAPLAAAAAVAAVVAGSLWAGGQLSGHRRVPATGHKISHASPLSCPARYAGRAPWVPARPAGVDGRSRLVPRRAPSSALICAYAVTTVGGQSQWVLSRRRVLAAGFASLAGELGWQPRKLPGQAIPCTLIFGSQTNYLVGLAYPGGGTVWVAATLDPNSCVSTSNGDFTSFGLVAPIIRQALGSGRWPARPQASCDGSGGRLGQESAMVPAGSTGLLICSPDAHAIGSGYQALVSALNSLPTRVSTRGCSNHRPAGTGSAGRSHRTYWLLFSYPKGPPVQVYIHLGCYPAIDNSSLQANSASGIVPLIRGLLKSG
jgi:hypothetical protein